MGVIPASLQTTDVIERPTGECRDNKGFISVGQMISFAKIMRQLFLSVLERGRDFVPTPDTTC